MRLTEIRGYHVEAILPRKLRNAVTQFSSRASLVVELVTDSGVSGWGETQSPATSWAVIEASLAPLVLGQDPASCGMLWRRMLGDGHADPTVMRAISAIDMALWDLRGRATGQSIAGLLGGRLRDRVLAYASGPFMLPGNDPYREFEQEAEAYRAAGFRALKARSGLDPQRDAGMAARLRRQLGSDFALMLDINRGYALPSALEALRLLDDVGMLWLEEPLGAQDFAGYRQLAGRAGTALAAGEALAGLREFRDLLQSHAVAIIQPDLYQCGGITGALRIAALAEAFDTAYVPHVWGTAINFHASLQLAAVLPPRRVREGLELPIFECERCGNPLIDVCGEPRLNADGTLTIPDAPGIGIDVSRDSFAPYMRRTWQLTQH